MPFPNWHAARLRDPDAFVRIRLLWEHGGIQAYGGPLKSDPDGGTEIQVLRFAKDQWTATAAHAWLARNGHKPIAFEEAREVQAMTDEELRDPGANELVPYGEEEVRYER